MTFVLHWSRDQPMMWQTLSGPLQWEWGSQCYHWGTDVYFLGYFQCCSCHWWTHRNETECLDKTSRSTSTSTRIYTHGVQRNCQCRKSTSWHSAHSVPPCKTQLAESCQKSYGMTMIERSPRLSKTASMKPIGHTRSTESHSFVKTLRLWRQEVKSMSLHTKSPITVATMEVTRSTTLVTMAKEISSNGSSYKRNNYNNKSNDTECRFHFRPWELKELCQILWERVNDPQQQAKYPTYFFKNHRGNAYIEEVDLKAIAETLDHSIEVLIEEINEMILFEDNGHLNSHLWLAPLKQGYDPEHYYKDTDLHSKVQEIYTATIGYNTGRVFAIQINGCIVHALLDTGAKRSCMNLETFENLKINYLNTNFIPTVKRCYRAWHACSRNHNLWFQN